MMIERVVDGDQRHAALACDALDFAQAAAVLTSIEHGGSQPSVGAQLGEKRFDVSRIFRRHHDQQQSFAIFGIEQIGKEKKTITVGRARLTQAEKPAEIAIGGAILRISKDIGRAIAENQTSADQKARTSYSLLFAPFLIGAHHASQAVAIGDADGGIAQIGRLDDEVAWMRSAAQEGIVGGDSQLRIAHAKMPCRYQRGAPTWWNRPSR